jgi:hypothetical protein
LPTASNITIKETLELLDGPLSAVAKAIAHGGYTFWLGSGISRDRVVGLDGVLIKLLDYLRSNSTAAPDCAYKLALNHIVGLAALDTAQRAQIDLGMPPQDWGCIDTLTSRLWDKYSQVLSTEIAGKPGDFLLWVGLDFPTTFAAEEPDCEHLAIGMLVLEGAISEIATPNWDGLIEAAIDQLGHANKVFKITVTGDDLRLPEAAFATLYKFHGCAVRAIKEEAKYRPLLIARSGQIQGWINSQTFKLVRDQLEGIIQRSRAILIGLSAQDTNIKNLFSAVGAIKGWKWNASPTPIVISAEALGQDHKDLLNVAYGDDYDPNRDQICESARVRAYAKPLLLALLLSVLTEKLKVLASDVAAPNLDAAALSEIESGLVFIRDNIAEAGNAKRLELTQTVAAGLSRMRHQISDGLSKAGVQPYYALDSHPAHLMKGKQSLASTGLREAAAALGLIGLDGQAGSWKMKCDDPALPKSGPLRLASGGTEARIIFAANDDTINTLLGEGVFAEDDSDVVVICSKNVTPPQQRNPGGVYRTGSVGPRYVSLGVMFKDAANLDDLRDAFRKKISI